MSGRAIVPLLVVVALAGGCGDSRPKAPQSVADVKGTPLRASGAAKLPPDVAALGDIDGASPPTAAPSNGGASGAASDADAEPAPTTAPPVVETPVAETYDDYRVVGFDELAGFDYALYAQDATTTTHDVPAKIRALSGKKVAVDGFMLPLAYEAGGAKKFLLMKDQYSCCFAATPKINDWVEVTMEGGAAAEYIQHVLVTVWGVLDVTPEAREGMSTGLYKMKATRTEFTEAK